MTTAMPIALRNRLQSLGVLDDESVSTHTPAVSPTSTVSPGTQAQIRAAYYERIKSRSRSGWPILLEGPAASGKTTAVQQLADEMGMKLFIQQAYRTLDVGEVRGSRGIDSQGTKFDPGLLTRSLRHRRGWYFIDEINMADPAILSLINNLLDGSRQITIPETGKTIRAPEHWRFFGAYNSGYAGTGQLNEALVSRCVVVECSHFPSDVEAQLIRNRYPSVGEDAIRIVDLANLVRATKDNGEHPFDMCLRTCFQLAEEFLESKHLCQAFANIVLPKVGDRFTFGPVRESLLRAAEVLLSGHNKKSRRP